MAEDLIGWSKMFPLSCPLKSVTRKLFLLNGTLEMLKVELTVRLLCLWLKLPLRKNLCPLVSFFRTLSELTNFGFASEGDLPAKIDIKSGFPADGRVKADIFPSALIIGVKDPSEQFAPFDTGVAGIFLTNCSLLSLLSIPESNSIPCFE